MARPKQTDYEICKTCTHTVNSHTKDGEVGSCGAYFCTCEKFEG